MDVLPASEENCYQHHSQTGSSLLCKRLTFKTLHEYGRAGGIRTHDLLNPIQAHYQAVLRPDAKESQDAAPKRRFQAGKAPIRQETIPISVLTIADPGGGYRQFPDALPHHRGAETPVREILAGRVNNPRNDQTSKVEHQTVSKTHD